MLEAPEDTVVDDISFCTASDMTARDPVSFRIDGSSNGRDWAILHDTGSAAGAVFPTPLERRTWLPWLSLAVEGPAPELSGLEVAAPGKVRHRCTVEGCIDAYASKEGYLVRGKLLWHIKRKHPSELKNFIARRRGGEGVVKKKSSIRLPILGQFAQRALKRKHSGAGTAGGSSQTVPVTPTRAPQKQGNGHTPSPPGTCSRMEPPPSAESRSAPAEPPSLSTLGHGCGVTVLRLSELAGATIKGHVDVEATVKRVEPVQMTTFRKRPGEKVEMRRFVLQDGGATCLWALVGSQATQYGESLQGCKILVRCAKVYEFKSIRHLSGCTQVDVLEQRSS